MPRLAAFDQAWRDRGCAPVAGIDEAGIGPWAGPVVAAVVILKEGARLRGLNDSKLLTPEKREDLFESIRRDALAYGVGVVDAPVIDEINILQASFLAIRRALAQLAVPPALVLFDGCRKIPHCPFPQETVVKGDGLSACIAAASILAKVTRDRLMKEAHRAHPVYGFDQNKGYGTPQHQAALERHGACPLHRRSYSPVQAVMAPFLPFDGYSEARA